MFALITIQLLHFNKIHSKNAMLNGDAVINNPIEQNPQQQIKKNLT